MKMKFFIALIAMGFTSCKLVLKITGNFKNPKYESREDIRRYAEQYGGKYDGLYVCKDQRSLKIITDSFAGVPTVLVFNKDFENLYADKRCPWRNSYELDSLSLGSIWKKDEKIKLTSITDKIFCIDGQAINNTESSKIDYYVFYCWAKFVPKLSKRMIGEIGLFSKSKSSNVYVGSIDLDLQKSWK